jgi:hypothetical protein
MYRKAVQEQQLAPSELLLLLLLLRKWFIENEPTAPAEQTHHTAAVKNHRRQTLCSLQCIFGPHTLQAEVPLDIV